jgi:hypothetical protein
VEVPAASNLSIERDPLDLRQIMRGSERWHPHSSFPAAWWTDAAIPREHLSLTDERAE